MSLRVVWAVDPYDTEGRPDPESLKELVFWSENKGSNILPVFVTASPNEAPEHEVELRQEMSQAKKDVTDYLKSLEFSSTNEPKILFEKTTSIHRAAGRLSEYARELGADLIVVSSHGRSGVGRWLMGSFAEKCLAQASVPLLFLSRSKQACAKASSRTALFATDFSDYSRNAFHLFLKQAVTIHPEIVLFHDLTLPVVAISAVALSGGVSGISDEQIREQRQWAETQAREWVAKARSLGIKARAVFSENSMNVGASIVAAAAKVEACLVALASQSRPATAMVLGSTAREVFRQGKLPVWVCGPEVLGRLKP